jgi:formylglycine-generating enzyme required for sulfatase activity
MKRFMIGVLGLVVAVVPSVSRGEWMMQVHQDSAVVSEFTLTDVDSVTFYYASDLVLVPAGEFFMGEDTYHPVTLTRSFNLGQHEVTNKEYCDALQWAYGRGQVTATSTTVWDNLDGETAVLADLSHAECEISFDEQRRIFFVDPPDHKDYPAMHVTWFGAARYCDWLSQQAHLPRAYAHSGVWSCNGGDPYGALGYRLPTEAEWEYAAQFDDERTYPWGNAEPDPTLANYGSYVNWTTPVGSYPNAPEALGLSDMAGNVWEWCNDWYGALLTGPEVDPVGSGSGGNRVERGGSWNGNASYLRCAERHDHPPTDAAALGLRIARTVQP